MRVVSRAIILRMPVFSGIVHCPRRRGKDKGSCVIAMAICRYGDVFFSIMRRMHSGVSVKGDTEMKTVYFCDHCDFNSASRKLVAEHEKSHEMTLDLAIKILRQMELEGDGRCMDCPRKGWKCLDCNRNEARDMVLDALDKYKAVVEEMEDKARQ